MLGKHYSKISIGTANLESEYGLLKKNKLSFNQFKKIINFCKKNKIKFIDTSNLYKDSEKLIGKIKQSKLKIITKSIFNLKSKSFNIRNSCINLRQKPYAERGKLELNLPIGRDLEKNILYETKSITLKPQKRNISLEFIWSKNLKAGDLGTYIEISKNSFNTKSSLNFSWIFSYKEKF